MHANNLAAASLLAARFVLPVGLACGEVGCRSVPEDTRAGAELVRVERQRPLMGTRFRVVLYAPDVERGAAAAERALDLMAELEALATDWDPASPVRRLGQRPGEWQVVPAPLFQLLERSLEAAALSGGAFDPTVGPLTRLWRRALRQGNPPTPDELVRARACTGSEHVELDRDCRAVRLALPGMSLDLGGIAKGFAVGRALEQLRAGGFERALVDGGGDLALGAPPPSQVGWRVRIEPFGEGRGEQLELAHVAVATSGDRYRSGELDGTRVSHLIDPRSGAPVRGSFAATVVAREGALADALASALCVSGPEGLAALAATRARGEAEGLFDALLFLPDGSVQRLGSVDASMAPLDPDSRSSSAEETRP